MKDLFNSINNTLNNSLYKLDLSIHNKIKNTQLDDFIHELREYLTKSDVNYRLSKLPANTLFEVNEIEGKYVQCYFNHEKFDIPKNMIYLKDLEEFNINMDRLQLYNDGLYHIVKH